MATDANLLGPACSQYEVLLEDYLTGSIDPVRKKSVEEHFAGCAGCSLALRDAQDATRFLGAARPFLEIAPAIRPGFARQTMARVRMEMDRRSAEGASFWQPLTTFAWRFAATAMLALMILLTYAARGRGRSRAVVGPIGQQPLADVFAPDPTREPANQDEFLLMVADTNHVDH